MEKNLRKDVLRKRCSMANISTASIVSTATSVNGYDTAIEGSDVESLYFSMDGTLQDENADINLSESETHLLTARKKQTHETNSPQQGLELPSMMLQSTPQILNKSRNIREEIPDLNIEGNTLHFEEEKSTLVDVGKLTDIEEDKMSFKVLEKSVTMFRGEKENNDPELELKTNLSENFEDFKLDDSVQSTKRLPIPTPRSNVVLSPKNEIKPTPSPRKLMAGVAIKKNPELSAIIETSATTGLEEEKKPQEVIDKKPPTKPTRMTISSRFRKSIIPANKTEESNIPLKRTRQSIAPPPAVIPSTRILRKSIAPTVRRSKSPVKKRQSIAVPVKPKTTTSSSEVANKRRSTENLAKKRQSMAKAKTPEKRRSSNRAENLKRRQSVAVKPKTPEKRRSADRRSVAPIFKPAAMSRQSIMPSTSRRSMMPVKNQAAAPQKQTQTPLSQAELTCDICKKVFRLKSNLTAHKRLHDSNATKSTSLKCSFCDKTFALKTAYENHLTQYCTKIPSNEKKKLMAAVKSPDDTKNGSLLGNKSGFVPPTKPPAKMHSGIERTPSKTIDCHIGGCNRKFKDPIAYTEHSTHHHSMTSSSGDEK